MLSRPIDLVMYASDASFYRLVPQAVVLADGVEEIRSLLGYARTRGMPMTFRAAGTSLSGQAHSAGILVEVARHWRGVHVEDEGRRVRVRPGTIAARVNLALAPYGTKLGPDPASLSACTIGGVLANNSSGMCCGVEQNAYQTLRSLRFVLPSGTVVDTADPDAARQLADAEPALVEGLRALRERDDRPAAQALDADLVPRWDEDLPPAAPPLPRTTPIGAAAVYLPSCTNRVFGPGHGDAEPPSLPQALIALARRAGSPLHIPSDVAGHCCGTPWHSKSYDDGAAVMATRTAAALVRWSDSGRVPVVVDASSCTFGLKGIGELLEPGQRERFEQVQVLDSVDFLADVLLPRLVVDRRLGSVAVHAVCSVHHLGTVGKLEQLAGAVADRVVNPVDAGCCGFAGDRGWLHPELTASALQHEVAELDGQQHDAYLSSNRTCEVGLTRATGRPYRSVVHLLEEATRDMDRAGSDATT